MNGTPIQFWIYGNQENEKGNPIPYHRTTQGAKWNPAHQRYIAWKQHVQLAFLKALADKLSESSPEYKAAAAAMATGAKPIAGDHERVHADIFFGNENHADPDNIIKGINDALFTKDKHVDVYTHHSCGNDQARVEITILN